MRDTLDAILDLLAVETDLQAREHLKALASHYFIIVTEGEAYKMTREELEVARDRGKIAAVKSVRSRLGLSLVDSKHLVEDEVPRRGYSFRRWD
jgi:ribosomal protein L7/L12